MKDKINIYNIGLAILLILILAGCSPNRPSDEVLLGTPAAKSEFSPGPLPEALQTNQSVLPEETVQTAAMDYCEDCHTSQEKLMSEAIPDTGTENAMVGWGTPQSPVETWEKVLVVPDEYQGDIHNAASCTFCHGGVQAPDKESAHEGLVARPSEGADSVCATCHVHTERTHTFMDSSLHYTLEGFWTALNVRSGSTSGEKNPDLEKMFGDNCSSCHASCGDCHVSKPLAAGGGFIEGHNFKKSPSMTDNCTACHGSRIGSEYLGNNEGYLGDVHYVQEQMTCMDCHNADRVHGNYTEVINGESTVAKPESYHSGNPNPQCIDCHETVLIDNNVFHTIHAGDIACQVCHSISYTSCEGCHVSGSDGSTNPGYALDNSFLGFFIGKNPLKSESRPYDYVTVRHVPVTKTSFDAYGKNLLSAFDTMPTWVYTTPHNIQLRTPQTQSCDTCHVNPKYFLTKDKIKIEEMKANQDVIVDVIPEGAFRSLKVTR